jgi:hypothetical protein
MSFRRQHTVGSLTNPPRVVAGHPRCAVLVFATLMHARPAPPVVWIGCSQLRAPDQAPRLAELCDSPHEFPTCPRGLVAGHKPSSLTTQLRVKYKTGGSRHLWQSKEGRLGAKPSPHPCDAVAGRMILSFVTSPRLASPSRNSRADSRDDARSARSARRKRIRRTSPVFEPTSDKRPYGKNRAWG